MRGEQEENCFKRIKDLAVKRKDMQLLSLLDEAKPNPKHNEFPDFILPEGFIEHFQVTAAEETRKGSKHNIAKNEFERGSKTAFEQESMEFLQSPPRQNANLDTYDMWVGKYEMVSPSYSYVSFVNSFKRNFKKHLDHLQAYSGNKQKGIFLIELVGANLTIKQNGQFKAFYRLAQDAKLLRYINEHYQDLKYIIFASCNDYELIKIENIPELLMNIPQRLEFGVGRYTDIKLNLFIDF